MGKSLLCVGLILILICSPVFLSAHEEWWDTLEYTEKDGVPRIIVKEEEEKIVLCDEFPSPPVLSPDGRRMAFISPREWEMLGEVFLYDGMYREKTRILCREDIPHQETPKELLWMDHRYLLIIMGFAYGTVSVGGDVYVLDTQTQKLSMFYETQERQEVKAMYRDDHDFTFVLALHDEEYMDYEIEEMHILYEEILQSVQMQEEDLQVKLLQEALYPETVDKAVSLITESFLTSNGALLHALLTSELQKETQDRFAAFNWSLRPLLPPLQSCTLISCEEGEEGYQCTLKLLFAEKDAEARVQVNLLKHEGFYRIQAIQAQGISFETLFP